MVRVLAAALLGAALPFGAAAAERTFTLVTVDGLAPPAQQTLRVTKGDKVEVNITSNVAGEVHLHGYRLVAKVAPAKTATWRFTAHATGRYRLEWHAAGGSDAAAPHHGPALAVLEVLPQ